MCVCVLLSVCSAIFLLMSLWHQMSKNGLSSSSPPTRTATSNSLWGSVFGCLLLLVLLVSFCVVGVAVDSWLFLVLFVWLIHVFF